MIAFQTDRDGDNEIYSMYRNGSGVVNLTKHSADDRKPSFSGVGLLAFSSNRDAGEDADDSAFDVYLLDLNAPDVQRLTVDSKNNGYPAISARGDKVAYVSHRDNNPEVYVLAFTVDNPGDVSPKNITNHAADDTDPDWSPDGCRIAFASNRDGDWDIFVANKDGSGVVNLTDGEEDDTGGFNDRWPSLSIEGGKERVVFSSDRGGNWEIYSMYTGGSGFIRATDNPGIDAGPSWGQGSDEFVFHSNRDGKYEIYGAETAYADIQTNITRNRTANDLSPDWEPARNSNLCNDPPLPTPTPTATPTPTVTATPTPTPTVTATHSNGHPDTDTYAHGNGNGHPDTNTHGDADPDTNYDGNADTHAHPHGNGHPDSDSDSDTNYDGNADAHSHGNGHPDTDTNTYALGNGHPDANTHGDAYAYADANPHSDADANPHSDADPQADDRARCPSRISCGRQDCVPERQRRQFRDIRDGLRRYRTGQPDKSFVGR